MNRVIAALHSVDYEAIGMADYGRPGNYLARQVERWTRQYRASETRVIRAGPGNSDMVLSDSLAQRTVACWP